MPYFPVFLQTNHTCPISSVFTNKSCMPFFPVFLQTNHTCHICLFFQTNRTCPICRADASEGLGQSEWSERCRGSSPRPSPPHPIDSVWAWHCTGRLRTQVPSSLCGELHAADTPQKHGYISGPLECPTTPRQLSPCLEERQSKFQNQCDFTLLYSVQLIEIFQWPTLVSLYHTFWWHSDVSSRCDIDLGCCDTWRQIRARVHTVWVGASSATLLIYVCLVGNIVQRIPPNRQ